MSNLDQNPREIIFEPDELGAALEVIEPRLVPLGGLRSMTVHRTIPARRRSTIGPWCFLDHYGPDDVAETGGMRVARHPHTGLATVSWLFTGEIDHLDSAGNSAVVRPGELNLMIAGQGITHSEISTATTRVLHGVQLWYALPQDSRFSSNHFEHFVPEPITTDGVEVRVFIGELMGSRSPVVTRTAEMVGAELILTSGSCLDLELRPDFEYGLLAESGLVAVNGKEVPHRSLIYLPPGADSVPLAAGTEGARVILIGGIPFNERIVMWWNFVGRNHEEIVEFRRRYQAELGFEPPASEDLGKIRLFGEFPEKQDPPLPAPKLPNVKLRPR